MAIDKLLKSVKIGNSKTRLQCDRQGEHPLSRKSNGGFRRFFFIAILLSFLVSSCSRSKLTQCEQIFKIAKEVTDSSKNVSYTDDGQLSQMKHWLETASKMDKAANSIQALHINDGELIKYQNQLVTIYRIYSQATYDAVKARESKSLEALKSARIDAQKAGQIQQDLIVSINTYCLNQ